MDTYHERILKIRMSMPGDYGIKASEDQVLRIILLMKRHGGKSLYERDYRLRILSVLTGMKLKTSKDLTSAQASAVIDELESDGENVIESAALVLERFPDYIQREAYIERMEASLRSL